MLWYGRPLLLRCRGCSAVPATLARSLSGHDLNGTIAHHYTGSDKASLLAAAMPAARFLAGYSKVNEEVFPPRLQHAKEVSRAQTVKFMQCLYRRNNLPEFQDGGRLVGLKEAGTASL